jgi:hypothetical protein
MRIGWSSIRTPHTTSLRATAANVTALGGIHVFKRSADLVRSFPVSKSESLSTWESPTVNSESQKRAFWGVVHQLTAISNLLSTCTPLTS